MKNGRRKPCRIIEVYLKEKINKKLPLTPSCYRYYMHFLGVNRRMDNWIKFEDIEKTTITIKDLETFRDKEKNLYLKDYK